MLAAHARYGTTLLGMALLLYAVTGLFSIPLTIDKAHETWLGPIVGGITGIITAATGVFVIPAVPYLPAIGLEKEDLVQALGLSFTVSTVALALNLALAGALNVSIAGVTFAALAMACAGVCIGQGLRARLQPAAFRRWFQRPAPAGSLSGCTWRCVSLRPIVRLTANLIDGENLVGLACVDWLYRQYNRERWHLPRPGLRRFVPCERWQRRLQARQQS
jgi:hypothetical protein